MQLTYQAEGRKAMLRERAKRCVCKYCGGRLRLKELSFSEFDDARTEIFCRDCDRIEFGVEPHIYESAQYFVDQTGFDCFPDLDDTVATHAMNVAKVCEILEWQDKMLGFLNEDGWVVEPKRTPFMGECLSLTDEELDEIESVVVDQTEAE